MDVIDIADLLKQHNHIRLLKIDIEGGEYDIMDEVLKSGKKIDYASKNHRDARVIQTSTS